MSVIYFHKGISYPEVDVASLIENSNIEKVTEVLGLSLIISQYIRELDMFKNCEPETCPMKPFKGNLYAWKKYYFNVIRLKEFYSGDETYPGLGYVIIGFTHPTLHKLGTSLQTSWVVNHDETGLIETRNSQYLLIGKEATDYLIE
jgi:hypothetical protein